VVKGRLQTQVGARHTTNWNELVARIVHDLPGLKGMVRSCAPTSGMGFEISGESVPDIERSAALIMAKVPIPEYLKGPWNLVIWFEADRVE